MRVELVPLFGAVPPGADNLENGGAFKWRFEEMEWPTVWPGSGVIRRADARIESETIWVGKNLADCGDYHSRWSRFPRRESGRFFCPSLFWWAAYYHWICDVLPRFHNLLKDLTPDVRINLPRKTGALHWRTLELLGIPAAQRVCNSGRRPLKVGRLLYASPVAMTGDHEPQSLLWYS